MTHTFFLLTTPLSATTRCQHLLRPVDTRRLPRSMATAKVEPALCADPPSAPHCANGFPRAPVDGTATWGGQEQWGSGEIRETYPHTHTSPWQPHTLAVRRTVEKGRTLTNHTNTPHAAPHVPPGKNTTETIQQREERVQRHEDVRAGKRAACNHWKPHVSHVPQTRGTRPLIPL